MIQNVRSLLQRRLDAFFALIVIILSFMANRADAGPPLHFEPYKSNETYKCSAFRKSIVDDKATKLFYHFNNAVIRLLSRHFSHETLLPENAIQGDVNALLNSFKNNSMTWLDFERNWIIICATIMALTISFTFVYLLYRCYVSFCSMEGSLSKKSRVSERRYDKCQRVLLDLIISIFIIVNLFASVILLISTQNAQFGMQELPSRFGHCINDINVYKSENNNRIQKLFRNDFQILKTSINKSINSMTGKVLNKFKGITAAFDFDKLNNSLSNIRVIQNEIQLLGLALRRITAIVVELKTKLEPLKPGLETCEGNVVLQTEGTRAYLCHAALNILEPFYTFDEFKTRANFNNYFGSINLALSYILSQNISNYSSTGKYVLQTLNYEIEKTVKLFETELSSNLNVVDNTLSNVSDNISSVIKDIDLHPLQNIVNSAMEQFKTYIQYSWITMLIIAGIFIFFACSFLLGLFFGCCGRRPSLYDDVCCVRSAGTRFYECGIWLSMAFMVFFSIIAVGLIFVGANVSDIICHTLNEPLSHPNMLSLLERVIDANVPKADLKNVQIFTPNRRLADLLRRCSNNETFFVMLELERQIPNLSILGQYKVIGEIIKNKTLAYIEGLQLQSNIILPRITYQNVNFSSNLFSQQYKMNINFFNDLNKKKDQLTSERNKLKTSITPTADETITINSINAIIKILDDTQKKNPISNTTESLQKLDKLNENITKLYETLNGTSELITNLSNAVQPAFLVATFNETAGRSIDEITDYIFQFVDHIFNTARYEIASCEPIARIARNTYLAVCDYIVDPINGIWMAMTISLIFMIPIIIIGTRLIRLYNRVDPLQNIMQQYRAAPTTTTDSIVNADKYSGSDYYSLDGSDSQPRPQFHNGFANGKNRGGNADYFNYQQFPSLYGRR